jgi:hypothetical protein
MMPGGSPSDKQLQELVAQYEEDLPHPELMKTEVERWQHHVAVAKVGSKERTSLTHMLRLCDKDVYPNIHTLLLILVYAQTLT